MKKKRSKIEKRAWADARSWQAKINKGRWIEVDGKLIWKEGVFIKDGKRTVSESQTSN